MAGDDGAGCRKVEAHEVDPEQAVAILDDRGRERIKTGNAANSRISKGRRENCLGPCDAERRTHAS